jgi:hypothetical protein
LLIGASSVFAEIQDSINMIWGLKPKPKSDWIAFLKNRLLSFSIIISFGFLLLVSLGISALVEAFGNQLKLIIPGISVILIYTINLCITIGMPFKWQSFYKQQGFFPWRKYFWRFAENFNSYPMKMKNTIPQNILWSPGRRFFCHNQQHEL